VGVLKRGLAPLTSGLVLGSAGVLAQSAVLHDGQVDMAAAVIAVVVAALAVLTRWNPFWLIVGAGAAGVVLA
jgi:chromate transport protein ChrA